MREGGPFGFGVHGRGRGERREGWGSFLREDGGSHGVQVGGLGGGGKERIAKRSGIGETGEDLCAIRQEDTDNRDGDMDAYRYTSNTHIFFARIHTVCLSTRT